MQTRVTMALIVMLAMVLGRIRVGQATPDEVTRRTGPTGRLSGGRTSEPKNRDGTGGGWSVHRQLTAEVFVPNGLLSWADDAQQRAFLQELLDTQG